MSITHDAGTLPEVALPPRRHRSAKPSATRMRALLDRRRRDFRCLMLEYCPADVEALVRRGFLDRMHRDDPAAIERAIAAVLETL
jgi:hypothetical protein